MTLTRHVPRYGYYADVANECQLFHVCYPVLYPDGQQEMIKWSFVCPNQTIFDQVTAVTDQYSAAHTPTFNTNTWQHAGLGGDNFDWTLSLNKYSEVSTKTNVYPNELKYECDKAGGRWWCDCTIHTTLLIVTRGEAPHCAVIASPALPRVPAARLQLHLHPASVSPIITIRSLNSSDDEPNLSYHS